MAANDPNAAQMNAIVQALQAVANQLAPAAPAATAFHRSPAQSDSTALLDFATRTGRSVYEESQRGEETKYDLSKDKLAPFRDAILSAADRLSCSTQPTSVCHFTPADGEAPVNIITNYGQVSLERITTQAAVFVTGTEAETRRAQNNSLLADYVLNSLDAKAKRTILTYKSEITRVHNGKVITSFPLLWKKIVSTPALDSKLTASNIRTKLRKTLPPKIKSESIPDWNTEFTDLMNQLTALGATIDDPEGLVLECYVEAPDSRFKKYWELRKDQIEDGEGELANANWETLLSRGNQKFNTWEKDWGQQTDAEIEFLALSAELEALRGQLELKSPPPAKSSGAKKSRGKPNSSEASTPPKSDRCGQVRKNKKPTTDKKRQKSIEAWKKAPPAEGQPKSKVVDGKTYHWCIHHMCWSLHSSDVCRLGLSRAKEGNKPLFDSKSYKAALASSSSANADPAVKHQLDFMAKLAGLSRLHE